MLQLLLTYFFFKVSTKRVTTERIFGNPAFDEYDTNKDKQITVLEFQKRLDIYQTLAQKLIQMADSNGERESIHFKEEKKN